MDAIDRKPLELLQADATLPIAELAQRGTCRRRRAGSARSD
jgi:DNA-binding Lrp family transcriptional regulator